MEESKVNEILDQAINQNGHYKQLGMATEECAELIQAVNKIKRILEGTMYEEDEMIPYPSKISSIKYSMVYFDLCSEVADVKILVKQLERILSIDAINLSFYRKIERLQERLNQQKKVKYEIYTGKKFRGS